jgi:hypothetical protein
MTRDEVISLARKAGLPCYYPSGDVANFDDVYRFAELVAEKERYYRAYLCEKAEFIDGVRTAQAFASIVRGDGDDD